MKPGKAILLALALALALPATASGATFTVNNTGDASDSNAGNNVCATAGAVCTLRAAIEEANAHSGSDTIKFSSLFDGTAPTSEIVPGSNLPDITTDPLTIDGGNCASSGTAKPCVEIDANQQFVLNTSTNAGRVDIRGLSITDGNIFGIALNPGAEGSVKGSWIGVGLDGLADGNGIGLDLESGSSVVGGTTGVDRNVFGNNITQALRIQTSDNRIRGNYFGVLADGTTAAPNSANIAFSGSERNGNVIGASIDSGHRATTKCDGGCNVFANSTGAGVNLSGDNDDTTIKGNFIGLDATGVAAAENDSWGITVFSPNTTVGGDTSAERNFIAGATNQNGIGTDGNAKNLVVKRNYFGLDSTGLATAGGSLLRQVSVAFSDAADPAIVSRNRFAGPANTAIELTGSFARVIRNKIGLDKNGDDLAGPTVFGLFVKASNSTIGEPGAGNTIGNVGSTGIMIQGTGGGDSNKVQGNFIGTDSAGGSHPNGVTGITLEKNGDTVAGNVIGGTSASTENVISNSGADAIRLTDPTGGSQGNQFKRNRGKDNGSSANDLFIDLGTDGFGNGGTPVQAGVDAPTISTASRTSISGTGAAPGATVYIFRTSSPAGASPPRINGFVDTAIATGIGAWSASFPQIPSGQQLTALQITADPDFNGSELALAVAP